MIICHWFEPGFLSSRSLCRSWATHQIPEWSEQDAALSMSTTWLCSHFIPTINEYPHPHPLLQCNDSSVAVEDKQSSLTGMGEMSMWIGSFAANAVCQTTNEQILDVYLWFKREISSIVEIRRLEEWLKLSEEISLRVLYLDSFHDFHCDPIELTKVILWAFFARISNQSDVFNCDRDCFVFLEHAMTFIPFPNELRSSLMQS